MTLDNTFRDTTQIDTDIQLNLQSRLYLILRIRQRILHTIRLTPDLVSILLSDIPRVGSRVVLPSRVLCDPLVVQLAVVLTVGSLVNVDDYSTAETEIVL